MAKSGYTTKQRTAVYRLFEENPDACYTAQQIEDMLKNSGIGKATVYRTLEFFEKEGRLFRVHTEKGFGYSLMHDGAHCNPPHPCGYNLMCSDCGKLIHMDCHRIAEFAAHIQRDHAFRMDAVLYGRCGDCEKQNDLLRGEGAK